MGVPTPFQPQVPKPRRCARAPPRLVGHIFNVRSHTECLRHHPISECPASIPDRRRRPGSAPGPPAPALRRFGPAPPPARSSSISESSWQLPSIAPRWPHSESLGPGCATTWPAVRQRVALRSCIAGVACRADRCLPSGGRARSESISASCAMIGWALSIVLIDLPFSHWTHVTFKHSPSGRSCWPALARDRCRPGPWSGLTDPTMLPCRIRSITPSGGVVGAAPSVEVLAGSAEPSLAPTLTSRLEGGLEVVVATAILSLGRGSGRLRRHETCCRRANVLGTR